MTLLGTRLAGFYPSANGNGGGGGGGGVSDVVTQTTADYVQPAFGATVNVAVVASAGANSGTPTGVAYVYNTDSPNGLGGVYFVNPTDATHVDLINVAGTPFQVAPALSAAPGKAITSGSFVVFIKNFATLQLLAQVERLMAGPGAIPTLTRADYVQPAALDPAGVNVQVEDITGFEVGDVVRVDGGGYYIVEDTIVNVGSLKLMLIPTVTGATPGDTVPRSANVIRAQLASQITNNSIIANAGEWVTDALGQLSTGITGVIWNDPARAKTGPNLGTYGDPFGGLDFAIAAVPVATTAAEMQNFYVVLNCQQAYNTPDLTVDMTGRRFAVVNMANLSIGQFAGAFGDPSNRINLLLTGDTAPVETLDCYFAWTQLADILGGLFGLAGPRISGQVRLDLTDSTSGNGFPTIEIHGEVWGDTGSAFGPAGIALTDSGSTTSVGNITLQLVDCKFYGAVIADKCELRAIDTTFALGVSSHDYQTLQRCFLSGVFDSLFGPAASSNPNQSPNGFVQCQFAPGSSITMGTGTPELHQLVLDADSYSSFVQSAVALTGSNGITLTSFGAAAVLDYGAAFAVASFFAIANGAPNAAASATQATALTEKVMSRPARLLKFAWNTVSASATTVIDVVVNGASVLSVTLTGASGVADIDVATLAGDLVALQYTGGTAPGNGTYQLSS